MAFQPPAWSQRKGKKAVLFLPVNDAPERKGRPQLPGGLALSGKKAVGVGQAGQSKIRNQ